MRAARVFLVLLVLGPALSAGGQGWLDELGERLSWSSPDGRIRAHVSGLLDAEYQGLRQPYPGLVFSDRSGLFNPRLTLFLDAEAGARAYLFAQARVDRGFDPGEGGAEWRLDEAALRLALDRGGTVHLQAGKFSTVIGSWVPRHDSWTNAFITAPLAYENLTAIWDIAPAFSGRVLREWAHLPGSNPPVPERADKHLRVPLVWGPSYATGVALFVRSARTELAVEVKNAGLSSRPGDWSQAGDAWDDPAVAGRVGFRPNEAWNLGVSAAAGSYLEREAARLLPAGRDRGDYRQELLAVDLGYAWRHWQVWGEVHAARYRIPGVDDVSTAAGYLEARYKFGPRLAGALRANLQRFSDVAVGPGQAAAWGRTIRRLDAAGVFRFTPQCQLKVQVSLRHEDQRPGGGRVSSAAQLTLRF